MSKAKALIPSEINHAIKICNLLTHSEGKRCALVLSHAALRVSEIALLQTKTVLFPSGEIREEVHLPAAICKHLKSRTIWLTNKTTRAVIQEWIDFRIKRKWGTVLGAVEFQQLNPNSKFLFSNRSRPYAMTKKPRLMDDGTTKIYWASDALEHQMRNIYKKAGFYGSSSHTGRKSLVTNSIILHGRSLEQMARILGHSDAETTLHYVEISPKRLEEMYSVAL